MEKEGVIVVKTALQSVLLDDLLLKFFNRLHLVFILPGTLQLTRTLIGVIVDFKNLIHIVMIVL
jgi:hypothetical protein